VTSLGWSKGDLDSLFGAGLMVCCGGHWRGTKEINLHSEKLCDSQPKPTNKRLGMYPRIFGTNFRSTERITPSLDISFISYDYLSGKYGSVTVTLAAVTLTMSYSYFLTWSS